MKKKPETPLYARFYSFEKDYPDLCEWWRKRPGWEHGAASKSLPKTGFIVYDDAGVKYGAVFLILGESGWGYLEFLVTNPASPLKARKRAIDLLVAHGIAFAKEAGLAQVFTSLNNENLLKAYERGGFMRTDVGMTNMICPLNR